MSSSTKKPGGDSPASRPVAGTAARFGRTVALAGTLAASGALLPILLQSPSAEPWMASVSLTVRDMTGKALPETLETSLDHARSEESLGRAVDLMGLERDSEFAGGETHWLSIAYEILTGAEDGATDPRLRAIRTLARNVAIEHRPGSSNARLMVRASTPDKAMKVAEALATVYAAATEITGALPEKDRMAEVERAEKALAEFRSAAGSEKLATVLAKRSRLKGLDDHRAAMLRDTAPGTDLKDATVNDIISGRLGGAIEDDQLTALGKAYADASMQHSALSVTLGPKHPRLLQAQAELAKARGALQDRLKLLKARSTDQAATQKKMLSALDAERATLEKDIRASGIDLARYDALVSQLQSARESSRALAPVEPATAAIYDASAPVALPNVETFSWWKVVAGGISGLGAALAFMLARRSRSGRTPSLRTREPGLLTPVAAKQPLPRPEAPRERADALQATRPLQRHHRAANLAWDTYAADEPLSPLPQPVVRPLPTVEKLRRVAPHLFETEAEDPAVERIRGELAELRRRVLSTAGRRI